MPGLSTKIPILLTLRGIKDKKHKNPALKADSRIFIIA